MLSFDFKDHGPNRILLLGAHSDDIEIGCGGTVLKLLQDFPAVEVLWTVFGANKIRAKEAHEAAGLFLADCRKKTVVVKDFRDGYFPYVGAEIKDYFEVIKRSFEPDIVFTHYRDDRHQDHRAISDLTWNTFRDHLILEYEIPKYDGDLGSPNLFVHLDEQICRRKVTHILSTFRSQTSKHWFTEDTFIALPRLRGVESSSPGKCAEAFYCRKLIW